MGVLRRAFAAQPVDALLELEVFLFGAAQFLD
jgi:hypothetical protein